MNEGETYSLKWIRSSREFARQRQTTLPVFAEEGLAKTRRNLIPMTGVYRHWHLLRRFSGNNL